MIWRIWVLASLGVGLGFGTLLLALLRFGAFERGQRIPVQ
jgi:hypothetical protein